jgi:hypothetical protein
MSVPFYSDSWGGFKTQCDFVAKLMNPIFNGENYFSVYFIKALVKNVSSKLA